MSHTQEQEKTLHDSPAAAPAAPEPTPTGVLVGAGGQPLIVGLPIFGVGALALGMALMGFLPLTALGAIVPIILFATGLYQLIVVVWSIFLGQSIVAAVFGTFSGFWLSLGAMLVGLGHGWYSVPAANVAGVEELFFIAWGALFVFLLIPCLLLPAIYPAVVALVVAALGLAAAGTFTGSALLLNIAGYVVLTFAFLGFYAFVNVALSSMGARAFPPLGKPLLA